MTQAKVTQEQADAYLDGWAARHNGQHLESAMANWGKDHPEEVRKCFLDGYEDCSVGTLDFERMMGPNDLELNVP